MVIEHMSRGKILRRSLFTLAVLVAFSYGTAVGTYRLFPFEPIRTSVKYISDLQSNIDKLRKITDDYSIDSNNEYIISPFMQYNIDSIEYRNNTRLNNFDIYRHDYIGMNKINRLAYLDFDNGLLSVYSQDNYSIIADTGIGRKEFQDGVEKDGGIRNMFFYQSNLIALVGLVNSETECAYASLVNISLKLVLLKFPCLPQFEFILMEGLGGGFVSMPDSETLLLALGVPESRGEEIRALAQIQSSPYGKILKILEPTILGNENSYSIYSFGHRNPQSILNNGEKIVAVEHGPRGGDEINLIEEGNNYGWPIVSLGSHYEFQYIDKTSNGDNTNNEEMRDPLFAFLPAVATSVISRCPLNYEKYYLPNRCVLIGSLRARSLFFVQIDETYSKVLAIEQYELGSRIRKILTEGDNIIVGTDYEGFQNRHDYTGISFLKLRPVTK